MLSLLVALPSNAVADDDDDDDKVELTRGFVVVEEDRGTGKPVVKQTFANTSVMSLLRRATSCWCAAKCTFTKHTRSSESRRSPRDALNGARPGVMVPPTLTILFSLLPAPPPTAPPMPMPVLVFSPPTTVFVPLSPPPPPLPVLSPPPLPPSSPS